MSLKVLESMELVKLEFGIAYFDIPDSDPLRPKTNHFRLSMDHTRWDAMGRPAKITVVGEKL